MFRNAVFSILGLAVLASGPAQSAGNEMECFNPRTGLTELRIVNGDRAKASDWKFIVGHSMNGSKRAFCGGSLINDQWVLTAAHCWDSQSSKDSVSIHRVGRDGKLGSDSRKIAKVFIHPKYSSGAKVITHDVALLKLRSPFNIPNSELAILPKPSTEKRLAKAYTCAEVAGWGDLRSGAQQGSVYLNDVNVRQLSMSACKKYGSGMSASAHICAGFKEGKKDSCQGDSGGPLILRDGPTGYMLIGVVSFGRGCALKGFPGVYARVSNYRKWIFSTVAAHQ